MNLPMFSSPGISTLQTKIIALKVPPKLHSLSPPPSKKSSYLIYEYGPRVLYAAVLYVENGIPHALSDGTDHFSGR